MTKIYIVWFDLLKSIPFSWVEVEEKEEKNQSTSFDWGVAEKNEKQNKRIMR